MSKHTYEVHDAGCERMHCPICDGGLAVCTVCGGAEGTLTLECPGARMTSEQQDAVYAGMLDFYNGVWHQVLP